MATPTVEHTSSLDTAVIRTSGLSKSYEGGGGLRSLNLTVPRHSIFGFLGPNGAGKSTAIKLLLGLAKPTGGTGTIFGRDIMRDSLEIRRRVGYLAQDPRYYDTMTARETLRFAARFFYTGTRQAIEARVEDALGLVGLADKADRPIKRFSGGERQRLGIAQAQINHPDLLILDEPAAALDPMGRRDVLEVMARLRERTTIFYSTHILDDVQRVSDMVAILNLGQLVAQAPVAQLLKGGRLIFTLTVNGGASDIDEALARVRRQPWVSAVDVVQREPGMATWSVNVHDASAAEVRLLPLVMQGGDVGITDFGRRHENLEQIFMQLIEGSDQHDGAH